MSQYGNPYYFTGRRWDAETGFYYFRHRYYDPTLGRFTTRDPIGIWGDALNLGNGYTYAGNSPWSYVDPWGLGANPCTGIMHSALSSPPEGGYYNSEESDDEFWRKFPWHGWETFPNPRGPSELGYWEFDTGDAFPIRDYEGTTMKVPPGFDILRNLQSIFVGDPWSSGLPLGAVSFAKKTNHDGEWDVKSRPELKVLARKLDITFEPFGNFFFGFVGTWIIGDKGNFVLNAADAAADTGKDKGQWGLLNTLRQVAGNLAKDYALPGHRPGYNNPEQDNFDVQLGSDYGIRCRHGDGVPVYRSSAPGERQ